MLLMRRLRIWYTPLYLVVGIGVWLATLESGVHATIAGVAVGHITPARSLRPRAVELQVGEGTSWSKLRDAVFEAKESLPVAERLQHRARITHRPAERPRRAARRRALGHILGAGALAGVGFTVSLFVTGLAFDDATLIDDAKLGVLCGVGDCRRGRRHAARTAACHRSGDAPAARAVGSSVIIRPSQPSSGSSNA